MSATYFVCRAHFGPGPWKEKFGTEDGHPDHEGVIAKASRQLLPRYPVSLSPANVHALEHELEGLCPWSIDRLKRRCCLHACAFAAAALPVCPALRWLHAAPLNFEDQPLQQ